VSLPPPEVRRLADRREEARAARDFASADSLREEIRAAGFDVVDTPGGPRLLPRKPGEPPLPPRPYARPEDVPASLTERPTVEASVQWLVQGWPEDVVRGVESFRHHQCNRPVQHVVVEAAGLAGHRWPDGVDLVPVEPGMGWAAARNAGLRRASGRVVVIADGSVEAVGDVLGPLVEALAHPAVGLTGPFGIVTHDLREFQESDGPEVDAVEGYLMAFRRELVVSGLRFDQGFRFYRSADIELSFQIKALGLRATVTPVPVERHEHRMWMTTPVEERDRLSKRNHYRFLDRWRGRTDLLVSPGGPGSPRWGRIREAPRR
jgi:hypothetical protein